MEKSRRKSLDRLRRDYRRRVTTPDGRELVVRARRKIDAETLDPVAVPLPLVVVGVWTALRELRNRAEYSHKWIVEVFPRFDPARAEVLAEGEKREALDLVEHHALRFTEAT